MLSVTGAQRRSKSKAKEKLAATRITFGLVSQGTAPDHDKLWISSLVI